MATARDIILVAALIFGIGISFFAVHFVLNTTFDSMISVEIINQSDATLNVLNVGKDISNRLDYVVFAFFIAFILAIMITGWLIGGYPIFMAIYFLFVIIAVVISTVLTNIWVEISQASTFGTTLNAFPITNNIIVYLPIYIAVIGVLGLIAMFAKPYFAGAE